MVGRSAYALKIKNYVNTSSGGVMKKKDIVTIVIGDIILLVILLVWSLWPDQAKEVQAQACIGYRLGAGACSAPYPNTINCVQTGTSGPYATPVMTCLCYGP